MRNASLLLLAGAALAFFLLADSGPHESPLRGVADETTIVEHTSPDMGAALPGAHLEFQLRGHPASAYMASQVEDARDRELGAHVALVAQGRASYDPWLSRAAQEMAFQGAVLGDSPPETALSFILRSFGSPELSVAQVVVQTNDGSAKVLDEAIRSVVGSLYTGEEGAHLVLGIGEAGLQGGEYERRVVVVAARRSFQLQPTKRLLAAGDTWLIRGSLSQELREAHASVLYPNQDLVEYPVKVENGEFRVEVPAGEDAGSIRVSIDGVGEGGPYKLLQLMAHVDMPLPREYSELVPESEVFARVSDAEAFALQRLNQDREQLGIAPLLVDEELSEVARAHSEEMRDSQFFAHLSPTTGLAAQRLQEAGYKASAHGENLALNDSVSEAQASLMESVGHRRNIVNLEMTHVGIGLAKGVSQQSAQVSWHLTQIFARKVLPFDAGAAQETLLVRFNEARAGAELEPLSLREDLTDLAAAACQQALTVKLDELPSAIAERASTLTSARVAVNVHVFFDVETLGADTMTLDKHFGAVGIAFLRDPEDLHGRTFLVLIYAG